MMSSEGHYCDWDFGGSDYPDGGPSVHNTVKCTKAPPGWNCTRTAEHSGPCAAEQTEAYNNYCQKRIAEDLAKGEALRHADIEAKIARRKELGMPLICTADELDATPMGLVVNNCFDSHGNLLISVPESEWADLKQMEMDYSKLKGLVWGAKEEILKRGQDPEFHCENAYRLLLEGLNL